MSYLGSAPFPGLQLEIFHSFGPFDLLFLPTVMFSPLFRVVWMQLGLNYSPVCKEISQGGSEDDKILTKYWDNSSNPKWCAVAELIFIPTWCHRWAEPQNCLIIWCDIVNISKYLHISVPTSRLASLCSASTWGCCGNDYPCHTVAKQN